MQIEELLGKLRRVEDAVPSDIRDNWNFYGLRVHENGRFVSIAKREYTDIHTGVNRDEVDAKLIKDKKFAAARVEAGLEMADRIDPAYNNIRANAVEGDCESEPGPTLAGDQCYPVDCSGRDLYTTSPRQFGTLGWFFYLDDVLVGISNYHVLCHAGDATPLGSTRIYRCEDADHPRKNFDMGALHSYCPASISKYIFDLALVRITDAVAISARFKDVVSQRPYPTAIGGRELLKANEWFYLIGGGSTDAVRMSFAGVGSRKADEVSQGSWLYEQLFFHGRNSPGDSGAVVVHEKTNAVVGLNNGRDDFFTIASPLYRKAWKLHCLTKLPDGTAVPAFYTWDRD